LIRCGFFIPIERTDRPSYMASRWEGGPFGLLAHSAACPIGGELLSMPSATSTGTKCPTMSVRPSKVADSIGGGV